MYPQHLAAVEGEECLANLVPYPSELTPDKLLGANGVRGVVETNVPAVLHLSSKCRAALVGSATNGNHVVPLIAQVFFHRIGGVVANIHANLLHYGHCLRIEHSGGCRASRTNGNILVERL